MMSGRITSAKAAAVVAITFSLWWWFLRDVSLRALYFISWLPLQVGFGGRGGDVLSLDASTGNFVFDWPMTATVVDQATKRLVNLAAVGCQAQTGELLPFVSSFVFLCALFIAVFGVLRVRRPATRDFVVTLCVQVFLIVLHVACTGYLKAGEAVGMLNGQPAGVMGNVLFRLNFLVLPWFEPLAQFLWVYSRSVPAAERHLA